MLAVVAEACALRKRFPTHITHKAIGLVATDVFPVIFEPVQGESFTTIVAHMSFLLPPMDEFMFVKVTGVFESLTANLTAVLWPRVIQLVFAQMSGVFAYNIARVAGVHFLACVQFLVALESAGKKEGFRADVTGEISGHLVSQHVSVQMYCHHKSLVAHLANIIFRLGMKQHVRVEGARLLELLLADVAKVTPVPRILSIILRMLDLVLL
jgi:hypothetical protein